MTRRSAILLLIALCSWMMVPGLSIPVAAAASDCDTVIYDGANLLGSGKSDVKRAADDLEAIGADVRVVTVRTMAPASTLDQFIDNRVQQCASWQSPNGLRKNNLLVFAMSLNERKLGIFYGESWKTTIDNSGGEERIWSQYMTPQFKGGNFSDGFVDGMEETKSVLDGDRLPNTGGGDGGSASAPSKPVNLTGLWIVLGSVVGLIALAFFIWFVVSLVRDRMAANEKRRLARQNALKARDATTELTNSLGGANGQKVRVAKVTKYSQASDEVAALLRKALETLQAELEQSATSMQLAASASAKPDDSDLTTSEYQVMTDRYEEAFAHAQAAAASAKLIDDTADRIEGQIRSLDTDRSTLKEDLDNLKGETSELTGSNIKTDPIDSKIKAAEALLVQLSEGAADQLASLHFLTEATQATEEAKTILEDLKQKRAQLSQEIPALKDRIAAARTFLTAARECYQRISSTYAQSSWQSVSGNGSEAEQRIDAAEQSHEDALQQSDTERQEWDAALSSLQEGNLLLDKAESLLRSIVALEKSLQKAQQDAQPEIDAAAADIDNAAAYIYRFDEDIQEQLEDDLRQAGDILDDARTELQKELPDYLKVIELALDANSRADRIYADAVDEHEAAERLRRQAATTVQAAGAAISKADEFIDDHRSDVGNDAERKLDAAKQSLQEARRYDANADPGTVLRLASESLKYAKSAYDKAKSDFDEAEDDREEDRRRRQRLATSSSSISYSSINIGSSSSGGFGDSSWGSGGGSSGSFGGGGGSGGGSSGSW